jgi:hypothetical protein
MEIFLKSRKVNLRINFEITSSSLIKSSKVKMLPQFM